MSSIAIRAEGLGKRYRLGERQPYKTFREALVKAARAPLGWWRTSDEARRYGGDGRAPWLWALREVSLEVNNGEALAVIGHNGAGKSTLLKILSRITEPTSGYAEIHGRVGSLLEVGTGFHRELSGRENIYLNGALLGMRRTEITRKLDQIVAFAETERFLDTPVKYYSSGMYTRLAFAVAAHLEPEILLVDEVLAVGDAAFQKKCLGKMGDVATQGRTVLFVSHNMAAVKSLCQRAVLLRDGQVASSGPAAQIVNEYLQSLTRAQTISVRERADRAGDQSARFTGLRLEPVEGQGVVRTGSRLKVTLDYESDRPLRHPSFRVSIYDLSGVGIYLLDSEAAGELPDSLPARGSVTCVTGPLNATPGRCFLNVRLKKGPQTADHVQTAAYLDIEADDIYGSGRLPDRDTCLCVVEQTWNATETEAEAAAALSAAQETP